MIAVLAIFPMTNMQHSSSNALAGYFLLTLTALLWGTAFIFQKHAGDYADAFTFNFLRFGMAVPALALLFFLPKKLFAPESSDVPEQRRLRHSAWFVGGGAAVFMFLGISLQQLGLAYTTTGKSGFLTALYIILLPIMGLFVRQRCHLEVWIGAVLTFVGIYLLGSSESGNVESDFNRGDVLTIICAFAWAAQVLWLGIFARYANVLQIAIIQIAGVALLSGIVMLFTKGLPTSEAIWAMRWDLLYTGIMSAAVAFTLQIFGQRYVPPTNAGLIMSSEAIFAMLAGMLFLGETLTANGFWGCGFILAGIVLAQLQGNIFKK
ncbi:MAG: EamA family transporter [Gammaproteobacteria bacterium]|nr:MAG: EamA family transporter [Gammaproteobacteria bacterium]